MNSDKKTDNLWRTFPTNGALDVADRRHEIRDSPTTGISRIKSWFVRYVPLRGLQVETLETP